MNNIIIPTNSSTENKSVIQIFENEEFGKIRTIQKDDQTWFVAKDVCDVLGYTNTSKAVSDHTDEDDQYNQSLERGGNMLYINESGLYSLILRSNKPKAKLFKKWITSEVLPAIRKTGSYTYLPKTYIEALEQLVISEKEKERLLVENTAQQKTISILTHTRKLYTMSEIAKELGLKSATELNKRLSDLKIQYQCNKTWLLYSKYSDLGYESIKQEVLDSGKVIYYRKITQIGREFILSLDIK